MQIYPAKIFIIFMISWFKIKDYKSKEIMSEDYSKINR